MKINNLEVNLNTPINFLSYGLVGTNLTVELLKAGVNLSLFPINESHIECERQYQSFISKGLENSRQFNHKADCIKIFHQFALSSRIGSGKYIAFPIFELDRFTEFEKRNLRSADHIFVTCEWAKDICYNAGFKDNVSVVPLGYDPVIFDLSGREVNKLKQKTIFLCIGKFEKRKGHIELCKVFNQAFTNQDNVELWLLCNNPFLSEQNQNEWYKYFKESPLGEKIKIIPYLEGQERLAYLMRQSHFGISLSKAEGWNLPALEFQALGIPNIITNYSAHTTFCNSKNSLLIDINETEPANDDIWFKYGNGINNDGYWAKFGKEQEEQTVELLRYAHQINLNKDAKLESLKNECLKTAQLYTWEQSAKRLISQL